MREERGERERREKKGGWKKEGEGEGREKKRGGRSFQDFSEYENENESDK